MCTQPIPIHCMETRVATISNGCSFSFSLLWPLVIRYIYLIRNQKLIRGQLWLWYFTQRKRINGAQKVFRFDFTKPRRGGLLQGCWEWHMANAETCVFFWGALTLLDIINGGDQFLKLLAQKSRGRLGASVWRGVENLVRSLCTADVCCSFYRSSRMANDCGVGLEEFVCLKGGDNIVFSDWRLFW